jgi:hypothetical protein
MPGSSGVVSSVSIALLDETAGVLMLAARSRIRK